MTSHFDAQAAVAAALNNCFFTLDHEGQVVNRGGRPAWEPPPPDRVKAKSKVEVQKRLERRAWPTIDETVDYVSQVSGFSRQQLLGRHKGRQVKHFRHALVRLSFHISGYSKRRVARSLDGRDHSTVLNSLKNRGRHEATVEAAFQDVLAEIRCKYPAVDARIAETQTAWFTRR